MAGPAMKIAFRKIAELIPYARNSRTHSEEQVAQLAAAIVEFGWTNPVLADAKGIVAGHGRVLGAGVVYESGQLINLPDGTVIPEGTVPVIDCTGWSESKRRAYIIADNKLALNAGWDKEVLKLELHALAEADYKLDLTGFQGDELSLAMFDNPAGSGDPGDGTGPEVNFAIGYNLVFETQYQQDEWYAFLRGLKSNYPDDETVAARLVRHIQDAGLGQA